MMILAVKVMMMMMMAIMVVAMATAKTTNIIMAVCNPILTHIS